MKIKTITLSHGWPNPHDASGGKLYRVEKITDSVEYAPHGFLNRNEVLALTESSSWKVTIVARPKD